jgi:hypothetical protein
MSYVLRNALIPTASGYETTDVRIEGEQIAAIGKGLLAGAPDSVELNADNKLLLPGFVNAGSAPSLVRCFRIRLSPLACRVEKGGRQPIPSLPPRCWPCWKRQFKSITSLRKASA